MPEITEPESSSGMVALTCPSTRSGSGVVNISSVGRFGRWRPRVDGLEVARRPVRRGKRPIVRSVPGPCSRSESKRRSVSRRAFDFSIVERSSHACGRVVCVEPADVRDGLPQPLVRVLRGRGRGRRLLPRRRSAPARWHQLVVMRLTTSPVSGRYGRRSRPARAGSRPSSARGACGPESVMRAACSSERWSSRSHIHGGT